MFKNIFFILCLSCGEFALAASFDKECLSRLSGINKPNDTPSLSQTFLLFAKAQFHDRG